jgi:hypothetical protein
LLLLAVSYHHVWFSQNARGYTMLLFWTTLSTALFLAGSRKNDARIWMLYGAVFAAAMYTHLSAAFYFAAHGLIYAAHLFGRALTGDARSVLAGPRPFFGMAFGVALTLLFYAPMLGDMGAAFGDGMKDAPNESLAQWENPIFVLGNFVDQFLALGPLMAVALPPALIFVAIGAVEIWKRERLLAAIYLLQIPVTFIVLELADMRIWPRYFFVEISFLYLALVVGVQSAASAVSEFLERTGRLKVARTPLFGVAALAMIAGSSLLLLRNYEAPKQDLKGAVAKIERAAAPADIRAVYGVAAGPVIDYYAPHWVELSPDLIDGPADRRIWVVVAFRDQVEAKDPAAWRRFEASFKLFEKRPGTLGGGYVYIYVKDPRQPDREPSGFHARAAP